jgi:hypothetical protein
MWWEDSVASQATQDPKGFRQTTLWGLFSGAWRVLLNHTCSRSVQRPQSPPDETRI